MLTTARQEQQGAVEMDFLSYLHVPLCLLSVIAFVIIIYVDNSFIFEDWPIQEAVYSQQYTIAMNMNLMACTPILLNHCLDVLWVLWSLIRNKLGTNGDGRRFFHEEVGDILGKSLVIAGLILPSAVLVSMPNSPMKVALFVVTNLAQNMFVVSGILLIVSRHNHYIWNTYRSLGINVAYTISQIVVFVSTCYGGQTEICTIIYNVFLFTSGLSYVFLYFVEVKYFTFHIHNNSSQISKYEVNSMIYNTSTFVAIVLNVVTASEHDSHYLNQTDVASIVAYTNVSTILAIILTILPSRIVAFEAAYTMGLLRGERNQILGQLSPSLKEVIIELEKLIESTSRFDVETYKIISKMTFACQRAIQSLHVIVYGHDYVDGIHSHSNETNLDRHGVCQRRPSENFSGLASSMECVPTPEVLGSVYNGTHNGTNFTTTTSVQARSNCSSVGSHKSRIKRINSHDVPTSPSTVQVYKAVKCLSNSSSGDESQKQGSIEFNDCDNHFVSNVKVDNTTVSTNITNKCNYDDQNDCINSDFSANKRDNKNNNENMNSKNIAFTLTKERIHERAGYQSIEKGDISDDDNDGVSSVTISVDIDPDIQNHMNISAVNTGVVNGNASSVVDFGVVWDADNVQHHHDGSVDAERIDKNIFELMSSLQNKIQLIESKKSLGSMPRADTSSTPQDTDMVPMNSGATLLNEVQDGLSGFVDVINSSSAALCDCDPDHPDDSKLQVELLAIRAAMKSLESSIISLSTFLDKKSCHNIDISNHSM